MDGELALGLFMILGIPLLIAGIFSAATRSIAIEKGRDGLTWAVYGFLFGIIALIYALLMKPDPAYAEQQRVMSGDAKKCPHCAELIRPDAKVCRFCGRDVEPDAISAT